LLLVLLLVLLLIPEHVAKEVKVGGNEAEHEK